MAINRRPILPLDQGAYVRPIRKGRFGYTHGARPHMLRMEDCAQVLRDRLPGWTREDHAAAARALCVYSERLYRAWGRLADLAHKRTFGIVRQATDYHVSGIGRDEYPESFKRRLRPLSLMASRAAGFACAHQYAADNLRKFAAAPVSPAPCEHTPAPRIVPPLGAPLPTCAKCGEIYMDEEDDE